MEEPDLSLAKLYARAAEDELRRLEDSLSPERIGQLKALAKKHRDTEALLERRLGDEGKDSAFAIFRIKRDCAEV